MARQTDTLTTTDQPMDLWATSKSGRARIRCHDRGADWPTAATRYDVYALDGHELLPRTKSFPTPEAARAYANTLWGAL